MSRPPTTENSISHCVAFIEQHERTLPLDLHEEWNATLVGIKRLWSAVDTHVREDRESKRLRAEGLSPIRDMPPEVIRAILLYLPLHDRLSCMQANKEVFFDHHHTLRPRWSAHVRTNYELALLREALLVSDRMKTTVIDRRVLHVLQFSGSMMKHDRFAWVADYFDNVLVRYTTDKGRGMLCTLGRKWLLLSIYAATPRKVPALYVRNGLHNVLGVECANGKVMQDCLYAGVRHSSFGRASMQYVSPDADWRPEAFAAHTLQVLVEVHRGSDVCQVQGFGSINELCAVLSRPDVLCGRIRIDLISAPGEPPLQTEDEEERKWLFGRAEHLAHTFGATKCVQRMRNWRGIDGDGFRTQAKNVREEVRVNIAHLRGPDRFDVRHPKFYILDITSSPA